MSGRIYVRQGGGVGASTTDLTNYTGTKGVPFFDDSGEPLIEMGMRFANGEASQGSFTVIDPQGVMTTAGNTFNLPAPSLVTWTENASGTEIWLARGRLAPIEGGRGDVKVANAVEYDVTVNDGNVELRGQHFTEAWVRPAETDYARLVALQAYILNANSSTAPHHSLTVQVTVDDAHLCPDADTVTMPAKTYPVGTLAQQVVEDCASTAGKVYGVVIHHVGGSHLCLLYVVETDNSTYSTAVKISDKVADVEPTSLTVPVFAPVWDQGKATVYDYDPYISGLISIYGDNQSIFVENTYWADALDYRTDVFYDSVSVNSTQAAARASAILDYRVLAHITHRVSVLMKAEQVHLITAGMSIQIKAVAALAGDYTGIYQTRRIAELRWQPAGDGLYWAHMNIGRALRRFPPSQGAIPPAALLAAGPFLSVYDDAVIATGPLSYWRLSELTGTNAVDEMALHDGTYTNGPTLGVTGLTADGDTAVEMDGSDDFVEIGMSSDYDLEAGSLAIWFKTSGAGSGDRYLMGRPLAWALLLKDNGTVLSAYSWSLSTGYKSTGVDVADGDIHMAVLTWGGTGGNVTSIYLDGTITAVEDSTWFWDSFDHPLRIGNTDYADNAYAGVEGKAAIWDRVLDAGEVSDLYDAGTP